MESSQIKFRAWDNNEEWMVDDMLLSFDGEILTDDVQPHDTPYKEIELADEGRYELMQYTGMKDVKGVEIYEGDILFHPLQGRRRVYYPYSERVASYGLRDIDSGFGSTLQDSHAVWEVIGNIYENKDLLED